MVYQGSSGVVSFVGSVATLVKYIFTDAELLIEGNNAELSIFDQEKDVK